MKKIAVIAFEKSYANFIRKHLEIYLGRYAKINTYSINDIDQMETIKEKYIAISAFTVFKKVQKKLNDSHVLQVLSLALSKKNVDKLKEIPDNSKILLASLDHRRCMEIITQIYEAGFKNLDIIPYHGEKNKKVKNIKICVTPNELQMVPSDMEKVINIGERIIDASSVIDLADKMGIDGIFNFEEARKKRNELISTSNKIDKLLGENEKMIDQIKTMVELMEVGIIITDIMGRIYLSNEKSKSILKDKFKIIDGFLIEDILPELNLNLEKINKKSAEKIVSINNNDIIITITSIVSNNMKTGYILIFNNFQEIENKQHGIRSKISGNKHIAKFEFENIKGKSKNIKETITIAKRMSKSEASVLIEGETGTGKEVFAQSIHNLSSRKKYNFVAVNCAAIPENLLESAMFGYGKGAFTGAVKGGKIGFFELAHKGTIFLDEIGEMSLSLQSKLLRVLEERRFSKVGSLKLIDIDIRVIAATNRNLQELIKEKEFRKDLYYRLNVLPLEIPNLRNRKCDIPILLSYFIKKMGRELSYSQKTINTINNYDWPGNVRELRNTAKYLHSLNKKFITKDDLPKYLTKERNLIEKNKILNGKIKNSLSENNINFLLREGRKIKLFKKILSTLKIGKEKNEKYGRHKLKEFFDTEGYAYTETQIRTGMRKLHETGYIISYRGRGGSCITESGIKLLKDILSLIG